MNLESKVLQPPRAAVWLLRLFAPIEEGESIVGDLLEEFSIAVAHSGAIIARSWYWRQTFKTVGHLFMSECYTAPWLMLVVVLGGLWLTGFSTRISEHAMRQFLDSHRIYEFHPEAYLFWYKFPLETGRVLLCAVIGSLVALPARKRELAAVVLLGCVQMTLFGVATFAVIFSGREWFRWFLFMLTWNGLCAIATFAGGAMVKIRRAAQLRRSAA